MDINLKIIYNGIVELILILGREIYGFYIVKRTRDD